MEIYKIENLSFRYPNSDNKALDGISFSVQSGEFITICGKSGCGKTTLLRLLKNSIAPNGETDGKIFFRGKEVCDVDIREQAADIGFIMQDPDNQIVTDKVWHELAFGAESLGWTSGRIRVRVAETASFFGIQTWFHKKTTELSGGQKQILNLAAVMVTRPDVIILDEPTSQLDPIAAQEFLNMLWKINRETGSTVILSEHRLEEAVPISDRVIVMDGGKMTADVPPEDIGERLKNDDMYCALPVQMFVYGILDGEGKYPLTLRDGKFWLEEFSQKHELHKIDMPESNISGKTAVEVKNARFRYGRDMPDIIKGLDMKVYKGGIFAVVGGNGTGKSTLLSLISGINSPYSGDIFINGTNISRIKDLHNGTVGMLVQDVQAMFVKKTVRLDLEDMGASGEAVRQTAKLCRIEHLLDRHPYDLSGGERQRAALAKVLLNDPDIILLDEPTKGMDAHLKKIFADILLRLKKNGRTVIMVSHDIEFCAVCADRCAMLFDGNIISSGRTGEFFAGNNFYTTAANKMAGKILPEAVVAEDIIEAFGKKYEKYEEYNEGNIESGFSISRKEPEPDTQKKADVRNWKKITTGIVFAVLFALTWIFFGKRYDGLRACIVQLITIIEAAASLMCLLPDKMLADRCAQIQREGGKFAWRGRAALLFIAVPLTVFVGAVYFSDSNYYIISMLVILEILLAFCAAFEGKRISARKLAVISVLCAAAAAGRTAFFMLPQFKPTAAVVIVSGICFGGETGFLVGAVSAFASNFFYSQGPWTPWQMISFGLIGFVSGILFNKGIIKQTRLSVCIFGLISVIVIYGGIMDSEFIITQRGNMQMLAAAYIAGFPFNLIHAFSTVFFLWFSAEPLIEKLERIKMRL